MEMIQQYLGHDPLYTTTWKGGYRFNMNNITYTFKEDIVRRPQELASKYISIQNRKKMPPMWA